MKKYVLAVRKKIIPIIVQFCNNTGKVLKKFIYDISIPRGIFSGQVLKIKGKGNVGINGGENGDLVINIA